MRSNPATTTKGTDMSATETVLTRNATLSERLSEREFEITPDLKALVLSCADHRVDPAHVLGLELGEAVILRNPGGRVTAAFVQELAVLAVVAAVEGLDPGFELIVMHHTDCGITRLDAPDHTALIASYFGVEEDAVPAKHLSDPKEAVRADIETLRANPLMPATLMASGIVYDVETGLAEIVCPPEPLGAEADAAD
jgi:carbonic anhydrase